MKTGLNNNFILCYLGNSKGNGGIRDFIYLPDKDGIKYKKKSSCEKCGSMSKLSVDHILPIAKGGNDCIFNKQTLCIYCNSKKSDTIDCKIKSIYLCERYKHKYLHNIDLSHILAKEVYEIF